jgi:hypothetical protein
LRTQTGQVSLSQLLHELLQPAQQDRQQLPQPREQSLQTLLPQ